MINGVYCKICNFVPRHQEIVSRILGETVARPITVLIGFGEMILAICFLAKWHHRMIIWLQILLVLTMNTIEFILARDLLLFGGYNFIFASIFIIMLIYYDILLSRESEKYN
ncbi:DoxX-like family protein [Leptospira sp. GIMC2001]|uniref:DoxX-like family protein n=1 Tax=Leptospira sp. GIMC2001 TaxID=1513297 RepID=UPI003FA55439